MTTITESKASWIAEIQAEIAANPAADADQDAAIDAKYADLLAKFQNQNDAAKATEKAGIVGARTARDTQLALKIQLLQELPDTATVSQDIATSSVA